ncbi:MAG: DUF3703 domain-containing protein [Flavobacteriaceae bacterium]|nr:DUF3703 domain-containing protein [Flavobacteriaceae bacterium]
MLQPANTRKNSPTKKNFKTAFYHFENAHILGQKHV